MEKTSSAQNNIGISRPPIVVIMGHIDHGKSTLLDYIRKSNTTSGEAGGITQHLGAYEVTQASKKITFLDTPGHEAFCGIRTRGANVADLAILVVSAEDGVKTQTLEALQCIKSAELPYIVAINKIDKPEANVERIKQNLAENEIYLEGYGGDIPYVPISAITGDGIPELLDTILLVAEMEELKAEPNKPAEGFVIEANLDNKKGVSATLLIKNGTIKTGMYIVIGDTFSPIRNIEDFQGKKIKEATFSSPVKILGFNKVPEVGSSFVTCKTKKEAENLAEKNKISEISSKKVTTSTEGFGEPNRIIIPIIIKTDVTGSMEGVKHELNKIKLERVAIKIIQEGIGDITENDIKIADGMKDIIIIGFNVSVDSKARTLAERLGVSIEIFKVIYKINEYVEKIALGRTPKIKTEETTGTAKIIRVFSKNKDKQILGGKVQTGILNVGSEVKIIRRETEIAIGKIRELQSQKLRVSEVKEGFEFGTMIESKIEIMPGDKIEAFKIIEK
ncbi:MAG: translation initiation factor IF-2 [Patescibacteria group bacterium]|nr:translation initiation factor IF-2 [Patescibacteria group bacterium]